MRELDRKELVTNVFIKDEILKAKENLLKKINKYLGNTETGITAEAAKIFAETITILEFPNKYQP